MPGFSPTLTQAARLFQIPHAVCADVLDRLISEGFLHRDEEGKYRQIT
jgi:hypothetical protein